MYSKIWESRLCYQPQRVLTRFSAPPPQMTDGLFLESVRKVAKKYPEITFQEMIIDNTSMQLVQKPSQFDVMVTPNLYGNIVTNIANGLIGGPGVVPGANFGPRVAFFDPEARHTGLDIAGKGVANPTALILRSCMMLRHLDMKQHADDIEKALLGVYQEARIRTRDLKGPNTTAQFTDAVINKLTEGK
jgi:isocitrate dehydrogenase (NAD+)